MEDSMSGLYDYSKDKKSGDKGELVVIKFLEQRQGLKFIRNSIDSDSESTSDFDLLFETKEGDSVTFEVKTDLYCREGCDTGNIAIEHRRRDYYNDKKIVDTGIRKTKANFYIYYYWNLNELWMIPTKNLFSLLNEMKNDKVLFEPGTKFHKWMGDGKRSLSYLIPKNKYKNRFYVFNFDRKELDVI